MAATTDPTVLAYDDAGAGTPVVLLHGLTFDRRTWRPIVQRIGGSVRTIAIDLPAHGGSGGAPPPFVDDVAAQVHALVEALGIDRPVVVGHSMAGGVAALYAAAFPSRGVVLVDNGPDLRPFARLVQQLEPALRGPGFSEVWRSFEATLGLDRIPEPERSLVLEAHTVQQGVVLGYWSTMLRRDPDALQAMVDAQLRRIDVPCLGVFGRMIDDSERERFAWLPEVQLEEWIGAGHFVHLVDPDRFAARLRAFVDECA